MSRASHVILIAIGCLLFASRSEAEPRWIRCSLSGTRADGPVSVPEMEDTNQVIEERILVFDPVEQTLSIRSSKTGALGDWRLWPFLNDPAFNVNYQISRFNIDANRIVASGIYTGNTNRGNAIHDGVESYDIDRSSGSISFSQSALEDVPTQHGGYSPEKHTLRLKGRCASISPLPVPPKL